MKPAKHDIRDELKERHGNITSLSKAVRAKCLDCCCGQHGEVNHCTVTKCALHPFRFGKNPFIHRNISDETRQRISERAKLNRGRNRSVA